MKYENKKVEKIDFGYDLEGIKKQIEFAARLTRSTVGKMEDHSYERFFKNLIKLGHGAMLEHGAVYMKIKVSGDIIDTLDFYEKNQYSIVNYVLGSEYAYITTNMRVIIENDKIDDILKYLSEPTEYHEIRHTFLITCDRITGESFLRHRVIQSDQKDIENQVTLDERFSYSRESTRYCNYSQDRFNGEITFMKPHFYDKSSNELKSEIDNFLKRSEDFYMRLLNYWHLAPEDARVALGVGIKSPLLMTGFTNDWEHFLRLRNDSHAHPDAQAIAKEIKKYII